MTSAFICGLAGAALTEEERAFLRQARPWGVILFRRNVESRAQNPAVGHPEVGLGVHRYSRGVSTSSKTIAGSSSEIIVFPTGKCLLDLYGGRGNPAALMKLSELILTEQGDVAGFHS